MEALGGVGEGAHRGLMERRERGEVDYGRLGARVEMKGQGQGPGGLS